VDADPVDAEVNELLDTLVDVLVQACGELDGRLDSRALTAYAEGIRVLQRYQRVVIEEERGRRVIGRLVNSIH
jgi:hypothetical protein